MPIPTLITDLSTTAASNSPAGGDSPVDGDNFLRALSAFIASLATGSGNGFTSPYLLLTGGTLVGGLSGTTGAFSSTVTGSALIPSGASVPTNGLYLSAANTPALASNTTIRWSVNSTGNHVFAAPSSGKTVVITPLAQGVGLDAGSTTNNSVALFPTQMAIGVAGGEYGAIGYNWQVTGSVPVYIANDFSSRIRFQAGGVIMQTAASGTAGNAITYTTAFTLAQAGNVTFAAPSSGVGLTGTGVAGSDAFIYNGGTSGTFKVTTTGGATTNENIRATGASSTIGYGTGAGGTVTQATSKSTGVSLNKACGQITMNGAALATNTIVEFVMTNTTIASTDCVIIHVLTGVANLKDYNVWANPTAGGVNIALRNISAGSLSEAVVLSFVVVKGVTA